jgi:hypothetical protein
MPRLGSELSPRALPSGLFEPELQGERLLTLRDLTRRVAALDPLANEGDAEALGQIAGELREVVERVAAVMAEILQAEEEEPDGLTFEEQLGDLAAVDGPERETARPAPRIGDLCFAGQLELQRALRELAGARTTEDLLTACETAHRKVLRAAGAVLETARASGYQEVLGSDDRARAAAIDCGPALAVRRAYAAFRKALRRPEDESPEAVMAAVRYAAGALATLMAAPAYSDIRVSDRIALRGLQRRALAWARDDKSSRGGLRLLSDVWTCADLLRGINQRQELKVHDAALIQSLRLGPAGDPGEWRARLERLTGLDDELDALLERTRGAAELADVVVEIRARLAQLG